MQCVYFIIFELLLSSLDKYRAISKIKDTKIIYTIWRAYPQNFPLSCFDTPFPDSQKTIKIYSSQIYSSLSTLSQYCTRWMQPIPPKKNLLSIKTKHLCYFLGLIDLWILNPACLKICRLVFKELLGLEIVRPGFIRGLKGKCSLRHFLVLKVICVLSWKCHKLLSLAFLWG